MRGPRRRKASMRVWGLRAEDEYAGSAWDIVDTLDIARCWGVEGLLGARDAAVGR